jgi:hypothetical protein
MSGTVSAQLVFITAAMIAGVLCMGPTAATAVFQPTLAIAAKAEVAVVEQVNGRRRYYRSYGYPYAYYPSAWGYYCPPRAYAPIYPEYSRGVPFRCCRPYYAPYY